MPNMRMLGTDSVQIKPRLRAPCCTLKLLILPRPSLSVPSIVSARLCQSRNKSGYTRVYEIVYTFAVDTTCRRNIKYTHYPTICRSIVTQ